MRVRLLSFAPLVVRSLHSFVSVMTDSGRPRVLIVDDDAEMRALLRDVLVGDGFAVDEHPSGEGLVALLEEWPADAVVLDKEMAGGNGLDLLAYIARRHPDMPVVFITAFGGAAVESEALRLGAACYLEKPFRVARLVEVLRGVVGAAGAGHGAARSSGSDGRRG